MTFWHSKRYSWGWLDRAYRTWRAAVHGIYSLGLGIRHRAKPLVFKAALGQIATRPLNAVRWILRRGPWVLGLAAEDRLHLGALGRPIVPLDLGLKLTRRPAGMA